MNPCPSSKKEVSTAAKASATPSITLDSLPIMRVQRRLSGTFRDFFNSEKAGGAVLVLLAPCDFILITNSTLGTNSLQYLARTPWRF